LTDLSEVEIIAENLRHEHYVLFRNDCITKSQRLKRQCKIAGIEAKVVICIGLAKARWFNRWLIVPVIHGWAEIDGKRVETSRRLGSSGIWDIVPMYIKPVICIRI
jgi:hypothetical protein